MPWRSWRKLQPGGAALGGAIAVVALAAGLFIGEHPWGRPASPSSYLYSIQGPAAPAGSPGPAESTTTPSALRSSEAPGAAASAAASSSPSLSPEPTPDEGEISVLSLVNEMSRLDRLARLPSVPFVAQQQSSTDRRARTPQDPDTWFANDDFVTDTKPNLVRVDASPDGAKRYVLLDAEGPGAIVRIWTATPTGTLRIHIDGDPRPALEADLGKLLSGQVAPFVPPFGQVTAMGYSLYFPFPYQRRCVVTLDSIVSIDPFAGRPIDRFYYQIGTRSYPGTSRTAVRPYSQAEMERAGTTMLRVARELRDGAGPATPPPGRATSEIPRTEVDLQHPIELTVRAPVDLAGTRKQPAHPAPTGSQRAAAPGGVISQLRLFTDERDPAKLRSTVLSIAFDGEETVRAPLVDFFGTGPGWNPYSSLPMTVGADGWLACRFAMPFRHEASLSIVRDRDAPGTVAIRGQIDVDPRPFGSDSLLFHARWHPTEVIPTRPFRDWHLGTLRGRGHLVGAVLDVENPPGAAWWGEGDEKIYVDGQDFPGIFGTGTEDYFGYAWSSTQLFAHPYHAQTRATGPGFSGQFSMNRFHILDPIPFEHELRFDLEAWHWTDTSISLDGTLYWYSRSQGRDDLPLQRR